ncbi:MAG: hotdog fold thioesterase [Betaproteobacteria bacterium]|mgnify:FL=1|jgi:1,4-dihydroxy-2-naphthoyl-CoA hydrolase|nr:hotdog fold thioesterase [Pseudomonadota bacterium]NBO04815.1 hotdog fold thioesterase [Betaproteobacteria bacterium]HAB47157.1 esterase [Lautropia sp.]NBO96267.1 hotdog fold thioesterase [Betaproteobacteria bacterium]NBP35306.1 hotdog fold thioesterase [Betaproteobacteria bacterium]
MSIWHSPPDIAFFQRIHENTAVAQLGIEFTEAGEDYLVARMPHDERTCQPYGLIHGGANVLLAETVGSAAAAQVVDRSLFRCVGLEINANHLRAVRQGWVRAIARPLHLGRTTQVWDIRIHDDQERLSCVCRFTVAVVAAELIEGRGA